MSGLIQAIKKFFRTGQQSSVTSHQRCSEPVEESPVTNHQRCSELVEESPVRQQREQSQTPVLVYREPSPIVIDCPLPTTEDLKKSLFVVQKTQSPEYRISLTLQEELDSRSPYDDITLFPREYEAPLTVRQPVTLDGAGATIWGKTGTVVAIESDRVHLKNLRIEATDPQNTQYAICVASGKNVTFENVEVRGMVAGIPRETGVWDYPEALNLGQLSHGCEHQFKIRIVVPLSCQIIDEIAGLEFFPRRLQPGANEIVLRLEQVPKDTLIFGSVFLVSDSLKRRLTVSAQVLPLSNGTPTQGKLIWEAKNWQKSPPSSPSPHIPHSSYTPHTPHTSPYHTSSKIRRQQMPSSTSWLIDTADNNSDRTPSSTSPPVQKFSTNKAIEGVFSVTNDTKLEKEGTNSPQSNVPAIPAIFLQENNS